MGLLYPNVDVKATQETQKEMDHEKKGVAEKKENDVAVDTKEKCSFKRMHHEYPIIIRAHTVIFNGCCCYSKQGCSFKGLDEYPFIRADNVIINTEYCCGCCSKSKKSCSKAAETDQSDDVGKEEEEEEEGVDDHGQQLLGKRRKLISEVSSPSGDPLVAFRTMVDSLLAQSDDPASLLLQFRAALVASYLRVMRMRSKAD